MKGVTVTMTVALGSLLVAVSVGLAVAYARLSSWHVLRWTGTAYTAAARSAPDFVWLLFLYYGGQSALNAITEAYGLSYIDIDALTASILILGIVYGGYLAETFRGAFLAIHRGQIEAGQSFGLRAGQVFWLIQFPQMMRYALPGIANNWLVMVKATAVTSMVSLHETVFIASSAGRATQHILFFYGVTGLVYLAITSVSIIALRHLSKKYAMGEREITL